MKTLRSRILLVSTLSVFFMFVGRSALAATEKEEKSYASPLSYGLDIKYLLPSYARLTWEGGTTFSNNGNGIAATFDWLPFGNTRFGKPGIGFTLGYVFWYKVASGSELKAIPFSVQLSYRLELIKNQVLVPFVKFGPTVTYLHQTLAAGQSGNSYYNAFDSTFGLELCLNALEPSAGNSMDADLGINGTYFLLEIVSSNALDSSRFPDLSGTQYLGGIRFEF